MYDEFVEDYEPTKADSYRKKVSFVLYYNYNNYFALNYSYVLLIGSLRRRGSSDRYSRYCWTGRLCCNKRQLLSKW